MSEKGYVIALVIGMFLVGIVFVLFVFYAYKNQTSIFTPYKPPTPPPELHAFYPLGTVTPMTAEEIARRNEIIRLSRNANF
jgi:hypothetical protein